MNIVSLAEHLVSEPVCPWQEGYTDAVHQYATGKIEGLQYKGGKFKFAYELYNELLKHGVMHRSAFFTPPSLARTMVKLAKIKPEDLVLDPCAGIGALLMFAQQKGARVYGYEVQSHFVIASWEFDKLRISPTDFLSIPEERAQINPKVILLNPPVGSQQGSTDIAFKFLAKIARLYKYSKVVAVLPLGYWSRKHMKKQDEGVNERYEILDIHYLKRPGILKPHIQKAAVYVMELV